MVKNVFYGVMLDILIFLKEIQEELKKLTKKLLKNLIMVLSFLWKKKDFSKIEVKNNICINVFAYENELVFPIYISKQKFKVSMDLLLLIDGDKSHYVYIKDFNRFMFHKMKNKNKNWFCKSCLQCFSKKNVMIKHKEDCLSINGVQSVKVEEGTIEFENYFKQILVPYKIYADFECISEMLKFLKVVIQKSIMNMFL